MKKNIIKYALTLLLIQGCDSKAPEESTLDKQVKACIEDVKLGLGDPESIVIVSKEGFDLDNGWFRIQLNFTAKNAMGGRVRGDTICGFKSKNDVVLNSEDFVNQERQINRSLNSIGIR